MDYKNINKTGTASQLRIAGAMLVVVTSTSPVWASAPDFVRCAELVPDRLEDPVVLRRATSRRLKRVVLQVARCARDQVLLDTEDNSPIIAAALNPLVDELGRRQAERGLLETIARSTGTWQNVWSDLPFVFAFADSIYQVVTPKGFYYNISRAPDPTGGSDITTQLLRGRYEPNARGEIDIFFTKNLVVPDFPTAGTPLEPFAQLAETGLLDDFQTPFGPPDPSGELASGELATVFIDDALRVIRGNQVGPNPLPTLFVLVRRDGVVDFREERKSAR